MCAAGIPARRRRADASRNDARAAGVQQGPWPPPRPIRSSASRRSLGLEDADTPSRRMLVIVNPYATTVSDRLKNLVVYALRGRYEVHAVDTEARDHATELCRAAAREGYDVVVAFGGDGTVNEAANGLVGSETPLSCLPGGRTNVYCRMLGIPTDVVDATEHLLGLAHAWNPRRLDVGLVNDRYFLFSAGVGLDASVVEQVDAHPRLKARLGEWYYAWTGVRTFNRHYLLRPPRLQADLGDESSTASPRSSRAPRPTPTSEIARSTWARARRWRAATWPGSCCSGPARSTSPRSPGARSRAGHGWRATAACTRSAS